MNILLTGATGFVGSAVARSLASTGGHALRAAVRREHGAIPDVELFQVGDIHGGTEWGSALQDVDVVVHVAGRAHILKETAADSLAEFRRTNVQGTLNLARQAAAAGVRRLVFVSSIKVNGELTRPGRPFQADDSPAPADPYGISKMEAEDGLRSLASGSNLEVVIVRPPLVYGPGVRANFRAMMSWLHRGVPLPLGSINNRRSLVALDNLVDLIVTCVDHSAAANQTFLVSDGEDLSTTDLLRRLARALGSPARLIPCPVALLELGARLTGQQANAARLCGSLQVDIAKTRRLLTWEPQVTVESALRKAAAAFLQEQS
jgi:UDP-glucose 4-epimerase